jgi:predicted cobalt transporter CbtA
MEKRIIGRGLLAGALGGVLAFVFARIFVEPAIAVAIAYEDGRGEVHEHGAHEHGVELFTRGVQANIGMGFGVLAFGVAMGGLLAVVYCAAHGRFGNVSPRLLSVLLGAAMLLALYVIPALKYPANPPSVGMGETIRQRTLLYLVMVVASAALLVAAVWLGRRLTARLGGWNAALAATGAYVAAVALLMLVLPDISETPGPMRDDAGAIVYPGFPADVLYDFRLYSLGTQVVLWATIGLVFAALIGRLLEHGRAGREAGVAA